MREKSLQGKRPFSTNGKLQEGGRNHIVRYQESALRTRSLVVTFNPKSNSESGRSSNDDYFPIGEEYEDELGPGWSDQVERIPARKSYDDSSHLSRIDEDREYFVSASAQKIIFRDGSRKGDAQIVVDTLVRNMSEKEANEKLEALQKKVEEFKRKLLRLSGNDSASKQGGQEKMMLWIVEKPSCGDSPVESIKKVPSHQPDDPYASVGESVKPMRRKKEKKTFCVKCPPKKPGKFFNQFPINCSLANGEGMERAEPEGQFFASTRQPSESRKHRGGFIHRFLIPRKSDRGGEAVRERSFLSLPAPGNDIPRRFYGKCGNGPKCPKDPGCPPPKKTPACPSPCTPKPQPCPPSKVRFRECPPPPKLPKLPKCPPPCPPPPPPPIPKCPDPPKCPPPCPPPQQPPKVPNNPPCLPPKRKCSSRQMSTYGLIQRDYKCAPLDGTMFSKLLGQRGPHFLVARRRISSSSASFACKSKSKNNCNNRSSKSSKKGNESTKNCPTKKSPPEGCPMPKKRNAQSTRDCRRPQKDCDTGCAPKPRCPPLPPPPQSRSTVQWAPPVCSPPKLVGPSPCPESSKPKTRQPETSKSTCPPPPPLPKPPCRPVCLCPCPPPPKLPPGTCPDVPSVDEPTDPSCPPPCPPKLPPPCPKDTWCPSKPICPSKK